MAERPQPRRGISFGVLIPDDRALHEIEDAVRIAEQSGDDLAVVRARAAMGLSLLPREADTERSRGETLLAEAGEMFERDHRDRYCAMAKALSFEGHIAWAESMT